MPSFFLALPADRYDADLAQLMNGRPLTYPLPPNHSSAKNSGVFNWALVDRLSNFHSSIDSVAQISHILLLTPTLKFMTFSQ
jgi:hypothetical protein